MLFDAVDGTEFLNEVTSGLDRLLIQKSVIRGLRERIECVNPLTSCTVTHTVFTRSVGVVLGVWPGATGTIQFVSNAVARQRGNRSIWLVHSSPSIAISNNAFYAIDRRVVQHDDGPGADCDVRLNFWNTTHWPSIDWLVFDWPQDPCQVSPVYALPPAETPDPFIWDE